MRAKMLTALVVKNAQPDPLRRLEIPDLGCRGLLLLVHPSGKKSWIMRFRGSDQKMVKLTLGSVDLGPGVAKPKIGDPLTLAAARRLAAEVQHKRAQGLDPVREKRRARAAAKTAQTAEAASSFGVLARLFIQDHARPRNRGWEETARLLGLDANLAPIPDGLAERWAAKQVSDIAKRDIIALLDECRFNTFPGAIRQRPEGKISDGMSRTMFAVLSTFFKWLVGRDLVERSPLVGLSRPPAPASRDRFLSDQEIRAFWRACEEIGEPFGPALKLLLLTGQRLNEIAGMRWTEIDDDGATLRLARERTKKDRAHFVPLGPMARSIIGSVSRKAGSPYVFTTNGRVAIGGFANIKRRLDASMGASDWRLHDLRRTFAERMGKIGVAIHVTEKILNHVSGTMGSIVGVYQRYNYADERRAALEAYEVYLRGVLGQPGQAREKAAA